MRIAKSMSLGALGVLVAAEAVLVLGCGDGKKKDITDEAGVIEAYQAFQPTILKITSAALAAKGTAGQGANIPSIVITGDVMGVGTMGGTVAQASGLNENLNLWVELNAYSDTGNIVFQTDNTDETTKLQFDLSIQNQPPDNGMTGALSGTLTLSGDVEGTGVFDLTTATDLTDDDGNPEIICTRVTGTVSAANETETLDFVLPDPVVLGSALAASCAAL